MKHLATVVTIIALLLMGYFTGWHMSRHSIPNGAFKAHDKWYICGKDSTGCYTKPLNN